MVGELIERGFDWSALLASFSRAQLIGQAIAFALGCAVTAWFAWYFSEEQQFIREASKALRDRQRGRSSVPSYRSTDHP